MSVFEVIMIGAGLAMDAFAASLVRGLHMKKFDIKEALFVSLTFGGFQAAMPVLGWIMGSALRQYIESVDHWIAFAMLSVIGGKMIWDAISEKDDAPNKSTGVKDTLLMAVATSIDALAVGVSLSFLQVDMVSSALIIGLVTFVICLCGVGIGHLVGSKFRKGSEILGGVVLICIGLKILLEHLGVI